jgi:hypothetical protein
MKALRILILSICGAAAALLLLPVLSLGLLRILIMRINRALTSLLTRGRTELPNYWTDALEFDPRLGFKARPHLDCYTSAYRSDPYRFRTCADGWPGQHPLADSEIIVVGDSMAAGQGVNAEDTYYGADRRIKAVACVGYDLVQEFLLIEQLATERRISGRLVVWAICTGNDLFDAPRANMGVNWPTPYLAPEADGSWRLGYEHMANGTLGRWFHGDRGRNRIAKASLSAITLFYSSNPVSERCYSAAAWLIQRAARLVKDAGATLVIVSIPYQLLFWPKWLLEARLKRGLGIQTGSIDWDFLDQRLRKICDSADAGYIAGGRVFGLLDYLSVCDDHLNERGHRKLRKLLLQTAGQYAKAAKNRAPLPVQATA